MRHYKHLSIAERERILINCAQGKSLREIARELGRSASAISREIRRRQGEYSIIAAQEDYENKRRQCHRQCKLAMDRSLSGKVEKLLEQDCSPEQISGRLKLEGKGEISYNTIYRGLARGDLSKALRHKLRIKGRAYRKGHKTRTGRLEIEHSIHERPMAANLRTEAGHWESDTVLGSHGSGVIATHVERQSRYLMVSKLQARKADAFAQSVIATFEGLEPNKRKSFTVDHGKECARYKDIQSALDVIVYFADPGSPGQRGSNENTNGLLRQYFPKRSSFRDVTQRLLQDAADRLNRRPRKCLGWRTPFEVFWHQVLHLI